MDNLKVHHCEPVKKWVEAHKHNLELRFLPSYSPELNPDEYFHHALKESLKEKPPAKTKAELDDRVEAQLLIFETKELKIRNLFNHPKVAYAA